MKKRVVRSPGRTVKGKERPGLLARQETVLESPDELRAFLVAQAAPSEQHRPLWIRQCDSFEAFARQFTDVQFVDHELASGVTTPLSANGKAGEVIWWADCLRQRIAAGATTAEVADVAMTLAGKMVELTVLANEDALIVGSESLAPKKAATDAHQLLAEERWAKIQKAAVDVWREHPRWTKTSVADELEDRQLTFGIAAEYVRKKIRKPAKTTK